MQCAGITPYGKRCNRRVTKGKLCVMHDPKYKKKVTANARRAGKIGNRKKYSKVTSEPFQELITMMVKKALIEILVEKQ